MPGIAASIRDTCELGSPPNSVEAPEKSFARDVTWAWTSSPTITSQSPVAPLRSLAPAGPVAMLMTSVPVKKGGSGPPRLGQLRTPSGLFDRLAEREQRLFVEGATDQLQSERQALTRKS